MTLSNELIIALQPFIHNKSAQIVDEMDVAEQINISFPFLGSKIDWQQMTGGIAKQMSGGDEISECRRFFQACTAHLQQGVEVVIVGDGVMDFAIQTTIRDVSEILDLIVPLPQHTYITPLNFDWCVVFTLEGSMNFGYAPKANI